MSAIDPLKVDAAIAEAAQAEIMSRFGALEPDAIREKSGPDDLVTAADEAAELALRQALHAIRPDAAFVGEESAAREPGLMAAIARADAVWIVDPLDGTRNFIRGVREFGVIVALVERGEVRMGWIHAAPLGKSAIAVAGEGVQWDGAPVAPAAQREERPRGLRSLAWLDPARQQEMRAALARNCETAAGHCSAYAYLKLLKGEIDFKLSSRIHPWDHVAGALMMREAGGEVSWLDGRRPYRPEPSRDAPLLAVAPGRDWTGVARRILG